MLRITRYLTRPCIRSSRRPLFLFRTFTPTVGKCSMVILRLMIARKLSRVKLPRLAYLVDMRRHPGVGVLKTSTPCSRGIRSTAARLCGTSVGNLLSPRSQYLAARGAKPLSIAIWVRPAMTQAARSWRPVTMLLTNRSRPVADCRMEPQNVSQIDRPHFYLWPIPEAAKRNQSSKRESPPVMTEGVHLCPIMLCRMMIPFLPEMRVNRCENLSSYSALYSCLFVFAILTSASADFRSSTKKRANSSKLVGAATAAC